MKTTMNDKISDIFRAVEADLGTTGLLGVILDVIVNTTKDFKGETVEEYIEQLKELMFIIKDTKPRIGIAINYLCELWDILETRRQSFATFEEIKQAVQEIIKELKKEAEADAQKLIDLGIQTIEDGDSILIHSHSKIVLKIIKKATKLNKKFRLFVAEQEQEKTNDIISFLNVNNIPFVVVPEFMLSHIESEVNKVFLGGLTLNHNMNFVADAGTNALVSEFHHEHIPIYMFIVTKKFSLWESPDSHHTYKAIQKKFDHCGKDSFDYERIKFSHDRVPLCNFDHIITENQILTPDQTKSLYEDLFKQRQTWRKKHFN